jgi:hypothetical protein
MEDRKNTRVHLPVADVSVGVSVGAGTLVASLAPHGRNLALRRFLSDRTATDVDARLGRAAIRPASGGIFSGLVVLAAKQSALAARNPNGAPSLLYVRLS